MERYKALFAFKKYEKIYEINESGSIIEKSNYNSIYDYDSLEEIGLSKSKLEVGENIYITSKKTIFEVENVCRTDEDGVLLYKCSRKDGNTIYYETEKTKISFKKAETQNNLYEKYKYISEDYNEKFLDIMGSLEKTGVAICKSPYGCSILIDKNIGKIEKHFNKKLHIEHIYDSVGGYDSDNYSYELMDKEEYRNHISWLLVKEKKLKELEKNIEGFIENELEKRYSSAWYKIKEKLWRRNIKL